MRVGFLLLVSALSGCLFFDEPGLGEDREQHDLTESVDCFADLPESVADELLPGACEEIVDLGADGVADARATYRYDAAGRRVSTRGGETLVSFTYDEEGNLELTEIDYYIDGTIDSRERRDYGCFEGDERPSPLPGPCSIATDSDADGDDDFLQTLDYEDGRLVGQRYENGGRLASVVIHEHDESGRLIVTSTDTMGDGSVDHVRQYGWDDDGHQLYERTDLWANGSIDHAIEYTLDEAGRRSIVEEYSSDVLRATTRYHYDGEDRVILETTSYPNARDHGIERRYDRAGNLLAEAYFDESQRNYRCYRYEYDCF